MGQRKKSRRTLRSASKVQEAELLENVRALREHPEHAVPECDGRCGFFCPYKAARKHAQKARANADDPAKLKRLAGRGNRIGRAYAGALLAALAESVTHFAQARLPFGTFPYVYRGTAKPIYHVAMQHWPDRRLRLLGAGEYARKRRMVVYALEEGMVCTHKRFAPPEAFVEMELTDLDLIRRDEALHTCPHPAARPALALKWHSAGVTARICGACAGERNSLHGILEHMAARDPTADFSVEAELPPIAGLAEEPAGDPAPARRYLRGEIGDAAFLESSAASRRAALGRRAGFLLVAGARAFPDAAAFSAAADASPAEARAVEAALAGWTQPIVLERASAALLLEALWPQRGRAALAAAGSEAAAGRLFEPEADAARIADLVRWAAEEREAERVAKSLPRYAALDAAVALADRAARAARGKSRAEAGRLAAAPDVPAGPPRGVALAILAVVGESGAHTWRYSKEEQELAAFVEPEVRALLDGDPAGYHAALTDLARKTGSAEPRRA